MFVYLAASPLVACSVCLVCLYYYTGKDYPATLAGTLLSSIAVSWANVITEVEFVAEHVGLVGLDVLTVVTADVTGDSCGTGGNLTFSQCEHSIMSPCDSRTSRPLRL